MIQRAPHTIVPPHLPLFASSVSHRRLVQPFEPDGPVEVSLRQSLREAGREHALRKGDVFFCQGDAAASVCWVLDGRVMLSVVCEEGREVIVGVASAGAVFGETALTTALSARTTTAIALETSTVLQVQVEELNRLSHERPAVGVFVLQALLVRIADLQARVADQMMSGSEERLVHVLRLLASAEDAEGTARLPPLSQEVLARMVGTTRSRINHLLRGLKPYGVHASPSGLLVEVGLLQEWRRKRRHAPTDLARITAIDEVRA
jgi:CRP/FNR family transcriptional regulator, cyclic AMP receptor protein